MSVVLSSQYIDCGNGAVDFTGAITICLWYKHTSHDSYGRIISKLTSSNYNGYEIVFDALTNKPYFQVGNNNTLKGCTTANTVTGNWDFIAVTYDGAGNASIRINDSVDTSSSWGNSAIGTSGLNLNIGKWAGSVGQFANGYYQDVRIYDRALSQAELTDIKTNKGGDTITRGLKMRLPLLSNYLDYSGKWNNCSPSSAATFYPEAVKLRRRNG